MAKEALKEERLCKQEGCPLKKSGICLEGLAIDQCPHTYVIDNVYEVIEVTGSDLQESELLRFFKLYSGEELNQDEVIQVSFEFPTNLILVVGEPNSGKTTLLASLYEKFQKDSFDGYLYAGSKTQIGYERRCHKIRIVSGHSIPTMDRTTTDRFHYLHLAVRKETLELPIEHLLFADISGEQFQLARNDDNEMEHLSIFRFSDHVFFLADGELLVDMKLRGAARQNMLNLIGRARQTKMLSYTKSVNVIISKWDIVLEKNAADTIDTFFIQNLSKKFNDINFRFIRLSAQSQSLQVPSGTGLDDFFKICLIRKQDAVSEAVVMEFENDSREFVKFKYRKDA